MNSSRKKIAVLGGGPAGLCVGWNLAPEMDVTLVERGGSLGGMCKTDEVRGFYLDYGPHNIHTPRIDILRFIRRIFANNMTEFRMRALIYFNRRFVQYPIKGINALKALPFSRAFRAVWDFFWARVAMFLRTPEKDDSFRDWITNRFGKTMFEIYFGPYAEKAWKIPAENISAYVAEKRVPILSISDYLRSLIRRPAKCRHTEDMTVVRSYYPHAGIQGLIRYLADGMAQAGGHVLTGALPTRIRHQDFRVNEVAYEQNGRTATLNVDAVFSTIPINELISLLDPPPPARVLEAAGRLSYSSERLLFLLVNREQVFETPLVYFQDPEVPFNRVSDIRMLAPSCVPAGPDKQDALCVEFTCLKGDDIWRKTDAELFDIVMEVFGRAGILTRADVIEYYGRTVSHAYPRFEVGFEKALSTVFDYLMGFENLVTLGRQGLFCYANIDDVLEMGFRSVEIVNTISRKGVDYPALFVEFVNVGENT